MKNLLLTIFLMSSAAQASQFVVKVNSLPSKIFIKDKQVSIEPLLPGQKKSEWYVVAGNVTADELKKLPWVKMVEPAFELDNYAIVPVDHPNKIVSDELLPYQWGILNEGQSTIREKDDIHNISMIGTPGKDVGWKSMLNVSSPNKTLVAVLDSGLDISHPEFKNVLWKNEKECGQDPKVDNDGNKLPGDCHGWNFTESLDSEDAKYPSDMDGHGTHVAGIIAAGSDGQGIVGVTQNALIMPIKVLGDTHSSQTPSSVAFTRGLNYAVSKGVRVINMSLGWPRSMETTYLREAVSRALGAGVIIVAAAGNNNNSEPLFPCAYDGVICVAATNVQGGLASFSNYGSHVDVAAPGENILSTNPTFLEPSFFAVPGYDIKSGTSQATPLVTGMLATLLALKPDMTTDEVLARIYRSPRNTESQKYILGGSIVWDDFSKDVTTPVVRPVLKRVRQIVLRGEQTQAKLTIPVRNFGVQSGEVSIRVESLSAGIEFNGESVVLPSLGTGEVKNAVIDLNVINLLAESNIKIKVSVTEGNKTEVYFNEIPVVRDLRADENFKKVSFIFTNKPLPLGRLKGKESTDGTEQEIAPLLQTVETFKRTEKNDFFLSRILTEDNKKTLEITLFQRDGDNYKQVPNFILVENALALANFKRLDLNFDGVDDYFVQTLAEKDSKKYFVYSFYDNNLNPLWKGFQDVTFSPDLYVEIKNDLSFLKYKHPKLGNMLVPAFVTLGQLPEIDQVLTQFDKLDLSKRDRFYYLEPVGNTFRVRSKTTKAWEDNLKKELGLKWNDTVIVEKLLTVTDSDLDKAELRVLVSVGKNNRRQYFIYNFSSDKSYHKGSLPQIAMQTEKVDPLFKVTNTGLSVVGDTFSYIYDRSRSKLVMTKEQNQFLEFNYQNEMSSDVVAGHILSFEKDDSVVSMLQTREYIVTVSSDKNGIKKTSKRGKIRYSFLSDRLLSELYYPVSFGRDGVISPALYVDGTSITANRIYLYEERNGELVSSIQNSIIVPAGCKGMNPRYSQASGGHEFVFLCLEEKEWVLRTLLMK